MSVDFIKTLKFDSNGLISAIIQDADNGEVLMLGYMNEEAVRRTLEGPYVTFWSRSRKKFWVKGEESGHTQEVKEVYFDCDKDALLIKVKQNVAACHEGYRTCFFRKVEDKGKNIKTIGKRLFDPGEKYKK